MDSPLEKPDSAGCVGRRTFHMRTPCRAAHGRANAAGTRVMRLRTPTKRNLCLLIGGLSGSPGLPVAEESAPDYPPIHGWHGTKGPQTSSKICYGEYFQPGSSEKCCHAQAHKTCSQVRDRPTQTAPDAFPCWIRRLIFQIQRNVSCRSEKQYVHGRLNDFACNNMAQTMDHICQVKEGAIEQTSWHEMRTVTPAYEGNEQSESNPVRHSQPCIAGRLDPHPRHGEKILPHRGTNVFKEKQWPHCTTLVQDTRTQLRFSLPLEVGLQVAQ